MTSCNWLLVAIWHKRFHILIYQFIHCCMVYGCCFYNYCTNILLETFAKHIQVSSKHMATNWNNIHTHLPTTSYLNLFGLSWLPPYLPILCKWIIDEHMAPRLGLHHKLIRLHRWGNLSLGGIIMNVTPQISETHLVLEQHRTHIKKTFHSKLLIKRLAKPCIIPNSN